MYKPNVSLTKLSNRVWTLLRFNNSRQLFIIIGFVGLGHRTYLTLVVTRVSLLHQRTW